MRGPAVSASLAAAVVGCLVVVGSAATACAQSVEITPFAGWRFGGGFQDLATGADVDLDDAASYGVILGIPWDATDRSVLELVWSHQDTGADLPSAGVAALDLDLDSLHLGGRAPFSTPNARLEVLLTGGIGATLMSPGLDGADAELRFSLSLGAGLLYHLSDRLGLRLEARGWYTFTETGAAAFCSGGCVIAFSGSGFGQGELTAGLQLAF